MLPNPFSLLHRFTTLILTTITGVLSVSSVVSASDPDSPRVPNILFVFTDDHSHRTIGCYPEAYPWVKTPNIDKLAKTGVRFKYAYIGTWCMPSRSSLLTGHQPYAIESMRMEGEYPGSKYDPEKCPFWPSVFRKNGYQTAQIGKWHTGTDTGFGRDWDYQVVWNRPRHTKTAFHYYYDQPIETNGGEAKMSKGYSTDNYTEWAEEYIRGKHRDAKKPWYLWLCYGAVHGPYTPAKRHLKEFPDLKVTPPKDIYAPREGKPTYSRKMAMWKKGPDGQPILAGGGKGIHGPTLNDWLRQYHQGVLAIDEGVGKLMAALKETGQLENTLVVFTSDQGFAWGQHGFRHKLAPYDATIRSPLIFSMPGTIPEGKVCDTPVGGGADLIPTFFAFAKIKQPWKMHGHDLTPLLMNPKAKWDHPVLTALTSRLYGSDTKEIPTDPKVRDLGGVPWWVSLRQDRYKYIRTLVANEPEELYDLESDPEELDNLALKPKHKDTLKKFRSATIAELKRTGAPFADKLPAVTTE